MPDATLMQSAATPFAALIRLGWVAVWRRNLLVWRKLLIPSLLGNFGDPLLYLLALGWGLGSLVGELDGMPYITFLASGIIASSAMNTATFEGLYSAYTRMTTQQTWDAMLVTPLDIDDIVLGEMLWAGSKSLLSTGAIVIVAIGLGLVSGGSVILVFPVTLLLGTCFGAMALVVTALSKSYDFFLYYFTLIITPMMLFGGVFFPLERLPGWIQEAVGLLPLTLGVGLIRPLVVGRTPDEILGPLILLALYTLVAYQVAVRLLRRRLRS